MVCLKALMQTTILEMDSTEKSSPETGSDSSMSPCSSDNDIFGDPLIHPRVGDEYQVEIPPLLSESERLHLTKNSASSEDLVDSVMPLRCQANFTDTVKLENLDSATEEPHTKVETHDQTSVGNGYCLVPGIPTEPWSDFESDCFLLGLYLLGKNLLQVARFVESKSMGQILAYYYGRFYASAQYSRWSESRKMKNKKCVVGHRFFTGYRQLELFSRLFPRLSEESKIKLSEASKAFMEGSSSLEEYVFALKAMVGINALVDAVGIGKGKDDLTTFILDISKNNQVFSQRPEMPSSKACSALTCAEITKYLTGDFRLSKAKSNDLFWEAVWPRLLARGWHSEQPSGNGYKGSNHLVFLMPGIKKFSRRKLSKGEDYFDSISDVLAKIASEPQLLRLEDDEANISPLKVKSDDDERDSSGHERHCYLKPRVSSEFSDVTKFTVVDTGLATKENPYKVTELRSLPVEAKTCSMVSGEIKKAETKTQAAADVLPIDLLNSALFAHLRESTIDINGNHNPMNHKPKTLKHQFSRRSKNGLSLSSCEGTARKKRRLSSYGETEVAFVLGLPARSKNATLRIVGPKLSLTDLKPASDNVLVAESNADKSVQDNLDLNHICADKSRENDKRSVEQQAVDLNLSQKHGKAKTTDVEKKKRFNPEKQKHCDAEKRRCSDLGSVTTSASKKPKHSVEEKSKISDANIARDQMVPQVSFAAVPDSAQQSDRQYKAQKNTKISEENGGPSYNMESRTSSASQEASNAVLDSARQPKSRFVEPKQEICGDTACPSVKMEPCLDQDQQPERNFGVQKQEISEDTVGPSNDIKPVVNSVSVEPNKKAVNPPDQQSRRQSTRSRPLTTKALEALELGFLCPPRQYRKRSSPSVAQDEKPKRSRQPRNKSPMFPNDMMLEVTDTCDVNL